MSMNVGDSTDLINGGVGGVRVFWRSRTDFEKKLLVIVAILSVLTLALLITVIVLATQDYGGSKSTKHALSLPWKMHPAFLTPTGTPTHIQVHPSTHILEVKGKQEIIVTSTHISTPQLSTDAHELMPVPKLTTTLPPSTNTQKVNAAATHTYDASGTHEAVAKPTHVLLSLHKHDTSGSHEVVVTGTPALIPIPIPTPTYISTPTSAHTHTPTPALTSTLSSSATLITAPTISTLSSSATLAASTLSSTATPTLAPTPSSVNATPLTTASLPSPSLSPTQQ